MPSGEISTSSIVQDAIEHGKQVFVPYIYRAQLRGEQPKSIMDMLQLRSMEDYNSLRPDKWGIPSLSEDSVSTRKNALGGQGLSHGTVEARNEEPLDLIVMPGVCFDSNYGRLGHGKGFYDSFLTRYITVSPKQTFLGT
jgi:5-formyltetrahydrofolate cyclo-ligase